MPIEYQNQELLFKDDFGGDFSNWYHEGAGAAQHSPEGALRLQRSGGRQGGEGCMLFLRRDLPDQIAVEYELTVRSHGGLVINFLAMRGLNGEDMITDRDKLPSRTGIFRDYFSVVGGMQSYHVSFSRFNDRGEHTQTSNWRRNPGLLLVGHGVDPVQEINRPYRVRIIKDGGHCQLYVDGRFAHAFIDHDKSRPIPDYGKFGFRLIGSEVTADIAKFTVHRVAPDTTLWEEKK